MEVAGTSKHPHQCLQKPSTHEIAHAAGQSQCTLLLSKKISIFGAEKWILNIYPIARTKAAKQNHAALPFLGIQVRSTGHRSIEKNKMFFPKKDQPAVLGVTAWLVSWLQGHLMSMLLVQPQIPLVTEDISGLDTLWNSSKEQPDTNTRMHLLIQALNAMGTVQFSTRSADSSWKHFTSAKLFMTLFWIVTF